MTILVRVMIKGAVRDQVVRLPNRRPVSTLVVRRMATQVPAAVILELQTYVRTHPSTYRDSDRDSDKDEEYHGEHDVMMKRPTAMAAMMKTGRY